MKPLRAVAMGLVVVLLTVPVHRYDVLADPLGWALVLVGLASLPVPQRRTLQCRPASRRVPGRVGVRSPGRSSP